MDRIEQARSLFMQALEHHNQRRLTEAEHLYRQALVLAPDRVSVLSNLAVVLASMQRYAEAQPYCERALAIEPGHVDTQVVLAACLRDQSRLQEAAELLQSVAAVQPDHAQAHSNLGIVLGELGEADAAAQRHAQALRLAPDDADAAVHQAMGLARSGQRADAFALLKTALQAAQDHHPARAAFVELAVGMGFVDAQDPEYRRFAIAAIGTPWCRPQRMAGVLIALLHADPAIARLATAAVAAWPTCLPIDDSGIGTLLADDVLLALLTHAPVTDIALERLLTALRYQLLTDTLGDLEAEPAALDLHCAVARQCFIGEYVHSLGNAELGEARMLRQRCEMALRVDAAIPGHWLAALGSYFPLSNLSGAEALLTRPWPDAVHALLVQQITEPAEERAARGEVQTLTEISDVVSCTVREQYEKNPYPRWVGAPAAQQPQSLDGYLQRRFPGSAYRPRAPRPRIDVLNAGCGTGQHPIETAQRFTGVHMLAVDLSRASLGYAMRKARTAGLANVRFAQADLLELPDTLGHFDLIEADGVLHHLADPARGLARLVSRLRVDGVMKLALYSEYARASVDAARGHIARRRYTATPEGIRACREDIIAMGRDQPAGRVVDIADFYTLSECRDLVFHVQEHRYTIPQLQALLADAGLAFIGFELTPAQRQAFVARFAQTRSAYDLEAWDALERQAPDTFIGMYQFWAQRADRAG